MFIKLTFSPLSDLIGEQGEAANFIVNLLNNFLFKLILKVLTVVVGLNLFLKVPSLDIV